MSINKISKLQAIEIANKFYNKSRNEKDYVEASDAKKSITSITGWDVRFDLTTEEGYIIDGPVFVYVDAEGNARII